MADQSIAGMTPIVSLAGTEKFYVDQASTDRQATIDQLKSFCTTGALAEAPADGNHYVRRNAAWVNWGPTNLTSRQLVAGAGLTGGGDLSADRTFAIGAGTGITVNADDIALTVPVALVNGGTGATAAPAARTNLGLGNVDNTSDLNKPVSTAQQTALNAKVARTGDTMSGALTLPGNPSAALEAAPKQYVDAVQTAVNGKVALAGDTMTGDLTISKTLPKVTLNTIAGSGAQLRGQKGALDRWVMALGNSTAESGGNAGTDFSINSYNDAGTQIAVPFSINRATGAVTLSVPLPIASGGTGQITAAAAFDAIKQGATIGTAAANMGVVTLAPDAQIRAASAGTYAVSTGGIASASGWVGQPYAATLTLDWATAINFQYNAMSGNSVLGNPTNGITGTYRTVWIAGNSATPRTLTFGSFFHGTLPVLTDITNAKQYLLTIFCVDPASIYLVTSIQLYP
jgi:hypothetical protein